MLGTSRENEIALQIITKNINKSLFDEASKLKHIIIGNI